jgi:carboxymethylenebutenolidase
MRRIIASFGVVWIALIANFAVAQVEKTAKPDGGRPGRVVSPLLIKSSGPLERLQTSPRHGEYVDIDAPGGRKVKTWVVYPQADHPTTVVLMIHENRGLTDWVRAAADEMAEAGYVAVAPDLLSGMAPGGGGTAEFGAEANATKGIYALKQEQVTADLDAVFKYAKEMSAGNKVVAVGGFCWGGGQTFTYATHNPDVASSFVFYGPAPKKEAPLKNIKAPVYGFYGGNDFRISGDVPKVEKEMKSLDKKYEPVIYKDADHAFMRQGELSSDPKDGNRKARDEAWKRWKKLLGELKPSSK